MISVPIGQYYSHKLINIGSNRWGIKPEVGVSQRYGRLFYEVYAGVWFYTENNQYFNHSMLNQKPLFSFQAHMDYTFKHGKYIALNGGFADGGETSLNDMERHDEQRTGGSVVRFLLPFSTDINQ